MSKMELLDALEAEKLMKQKWKQYCGTPCTTILCIRPEVQIVLEGFGTSSRILRGSPMVFVLSRNFAVTYALFGYFWVNLPDFQHFWVDFGHIQADFEHFLTAFISRFSVNGSDSQ